MRINLDGRVAIVTGAGQGLGRTHALALAERGAKVVVNDLGGPDGISANAEAVVAEIRKAGGEAFAHGANVADFGQVSHIDILVNNAGILRDKSFLKMSMDDFRQVIDVHLIGSANCSKAVWEIMREQAYGRIIMTSSSTGLYGNFGQTNYGAAKMAMVGMMNTLHLG
jgi:NAD(P)-dependent dehydrogenase (short-subunit alcohol dehydrogenase family)